MDLLARRGLLAEAVTVGGLEWSSQVSLSPQEFGTFFSFSQTISCPQLHPPGRPCFLVACGVPSASP